MEDFVGTNLRIPCEVKITDFWAKGVFKFNGGLIHNMKNLTMVQ
jgi:hypothetical protein